MPDAALARYRSRVAGCLLGGGLGDALGAPVEFSAIGEIRERYGPDGVTELGGPADGPGLITDDTQLTLFTCEGVIGAALNGAAGPGQVAGHVYRAYLRWLQTQNTPAPPGRLQSWLADQAWLYHRRAPGNACLSGLESGRMGTLTAPVNPESKGCGAVMRSAPFGLQITKKPADVMREAVASAVLTHGHPTGYLAAGAFAVIVRALVDGADLSSAARQALDTLGAWPRHDETAAAIAAALDAAAGNQPSPETIGRLGAGWVAEEALAIGLYAALAHPEPGQARQALLLAVNHSGDSDSTGSVCGNLLGAWHGRQVLPADWLANLEGVPTIEQIAADLTAVGWPGVGVGSRPRAELGARYPAG